MTWGASGPAPVWFDTEEEDWATIRQYVATRLAGEIASRLEHRAEQLRETPYPDLVMLEARKELLGFTLAGDLTAIGLLVDAMNELYEAHVHS